MSTPDCKDCKHYERDSDPAKVDLKYGEQCYAPQLRDYIEVLYFDGKRHQNSFIHPQFCRDIRDLCGAKAKWHEPA